MDYSEVCQGWIYSITNKLNGKMYIGQTVSYCDRKSQHFTREKGYRLSQAMKKYGKENFEMKPIVTFKAVNKKVRADVLNQLEIFYIKKYDTFRNGYNATTGGSRGHSFSEESKAKLSDAHKQYAETHREDIKRKNASQNKPILQYDMNGRFYRKYPSISIAAEQYPNPVSAFANISSVLRGLHSIAEGSLWKYDDGNFSLFIDVPTILKPIYLYSVEGQLIAEYKSINEAADKTGISINTIKTSLRKTKQGIKRKGNYWSRCAPAA